MFVNASQADGVPEMLVITHGGQGAGAAYVCVNVQVGDAENTAVIEQVEPSADKDVNEYGAGLVNGALSVTGVPPQELVMVSVPVDGALTNVTLPLTEYCCVAPLQAVGVVLMAEIAQVVTQDAGAL